MIHTTASTPQKKQNSTLVRPPMFSGFVWGLGAVVLTVTLQGLAERNDRYVFAAGFIVGPGSTRSA